MMGDIASSEAAMESQGLKPVLHVATVGAQLSSMADISGAMCTAAGVTPSGMRMAVGEQRPHADALLLVSGSHPVRTLPLLQQFLPGSVAMLRQASQLKQCGVLPQQLALWAVANPVMEPDASYAEQKIAAGAEVILTQPPLDWAKFVAWMEDAQQRQLHTAARLLVGFPLLSSAANMTFWAALCGAGGNRQCQQLQQQFAAAEQAAKQQQQQQAGQPSQPGPSQFAQQWNSQLLERLQATPGVSGLHVMPITANSKRMALQMARQGAFARNAWPLAGAMWVRAAAAGNMLPEQASHARLRAAHDLRLASCTAKGGACVPAVLWTPASRVRLHACWQCSVHLQQQPGLLASCCLSQPCL
ncbi:hypothetical protein COO60DRAFT_891899 [Scenedesmus sp. NREL 46B-D3]|nr:hypothetical protein COO60DRAFT_891899 [Scenedesmus sp. NREL 46B-D3]